MEVEGKIKLITDTKEYGSNGFRKREIVVTTEEQYPQPIVVEFVQDKTELLNPFTVGQRVKIGFNLRGREWVSPQGETKYFNSLSGWRIENLDAGSPAGAPPMPPMDQFEPASDLNEDNEEDDLPF